MKFDDRLRRRRLSSVDAGGARFHFVKGSDMGSKGLEIQKPPAAQTVMLARIGRLAMFDTGAGPTFIDPEKVAGVATTGKLGTCMIVADGAALEVKGGAEQVAQIIIAHEKQMRDERIGLDRGPHDLERRGAQLGEVGPG